jgi:hypothetical protein
LASAVGLGKVRAIVLIWAVLALVAPSARAGTTPVALVIESSGQVVPSVAPYSELDSGTILSVARSGRLVLLDYYRCEQVTVTGGQIRVGAAGYEASHATAERVPCQREIEIPKAGDSAGVVFRGGSLTAANFSDQPQFVLVGDHTEDFDSVRISRDGKTVLSAPLANHRFIWPPRADALRPGATYDLTLISRHSDARTIQFTVGDDSARTQSSNLVLLRVN